MKKFKVVICLIVCVLLFALVTVLYNKLGKDYTTEMLVPDENATEREEFKAPDFTVFDVEGNMVSLSDMKGKGVVINFWASWCPPCKAEMPDFETLYKKYGDKIHFMMVNMTDGDRETFKSAKSYIDKTGYTFPVYYDLKYSAAYAYYVTSLPATYFVDKNGNLVTYANGMINLETIERCIGLLE